MEFPLLNHIRRIRKYNCAFKLPILPLTYITYMIQTSQLALCKTGKLQELAIKHN